MAAHDENVVWHPHPVTVAQREQLHGHRGVVLWFTGLSGSGKSTVAGALEEALHQQGVSTYLLDGDNVRHGLCSDLGFSDDDRKENIRRAGEVASLMAEAGLAVLTASNSPHPAERQLAQELGVSRSSLREAIRSLIGEGVLYSKRGGGTWLCDETTRWSEERIVQPLKVLVADDPNYRNDILEARHAIEASTAWYAALRATPADKERLQSCFDAIQQQESISADMANQADVRFHLAIAEASHNVVLLQTMRGFFDLLQSSVAHSRERMYTVPTIFARLTEQHEELLLAILASDPERARKAAQHHLGFVLTTMKTLHEDEARQQRITRLPDDRE